METQKPILFDNKPHPWIHPEIIKKYEDNRKKEGAYISSFEKSNYETDVFEDILKKNKDFLIDDDLRVDSEKEIPLDDVIAQDYAETVLGRPLKRGESVPDDYPTRWHANRLQFLTLNRSADRIRAEADKLYNPKIKAEDKEWNDRFDSVNKTPVAKQQPEQKPSIKIDPKIPLFLQVGDSSIPWCVSHPLRKHFVEEGPKQYPQGLFGRYLNILDEVNADDVLEDEYIPSFLKDIQKNKPEDFKPELKKARQQGNLSLLESEPELFGQ
jgi:hypothetical protein